MSESRSRVEQIAAELPDDAAGELVAELLQRPGIALTVETALKTGATARRTVETGLGSALSAVGAPTAEDIQLLRERLEDIEDLLDDIDSRIKRLPKKEKAATAKKARRTRRKKSDEQTDS